MVYLKMSDYRNQKTKSHIKPKTKLPTQSKSNNKDKQFLIMCPTGCTQYRTNTYRMKEKKTFDTRNNRCRNCNFYKSDEQVIHPVIFKTGNGRKIN